MRRNQPFRLQSCYPQPGKVRSFPGPFTFSDVSFIEPSSNTLQRRLTGTIRTSENSSYFVDIFRSARKDSLDKKHEYLFHGQGQPVVLSNKQGSFIQMVPTEELSSSKGDLVGYDYFKEKRMVAFEDDFVAHFAMPGPNAQALKINFWMRGYSDRKIFAVMAPPSRAISTKSAPESLYKQPLPTLVVRQWGEAKTRPFVSVIEVFSKEEGPSIRSVEYFEPENANPAFVGIVVKSKPGQVDYIFNDTKGEVENKRGSQRFKGSYGVISYQGDQLHSIFLGNGTLLQNEGWRIVSKEIDNAVLIHLNGDQLRISARKSFQITLPIPAGSKSGANLEGVGESKGKFFTGKFKTIDGVSSGVFDLPAMDDIYLKLNSN